MPLACHMIQDQVQVYGVIVTSRFYYSDSKWVSSGVY